MPKTATESRLTRKQFFALMEESYKTRAKAEAWRPSELAATLACMDNDLADTWRKIKKAGLTVGAIKSMLTINDLPAPVSEAKPQGRHDHPDRYQSGSCHDCAIELPYTPESEGMRYA